MKIVYTITLGFLLLAAGCGESVGKSGDVVGGPCSGDSCASGSTCLGGGDFPDGYCTVQCSDDSACPSGTHCIDKKGGVCLMECSSEADCRDEYKCEERDRFKADGQRKVCLES